MISDEGSYRARAERPIVLSMELSGNTILITGGSSGIGLGIAERFVARGNEVVVCGRRESALAAARAKCPALHTIVADVGDAASREQLFRSATARFPKLNVLINNAGVQRSVSFLDATWPDAAREIAINLEGALHLALLFLPHLAARDAAILANVSSGLAFVPAAMVPIYSATKAALHSLTMSMRHQLRSTSVDVVEIIPPAVRTSLGGGRGSGAPLDDYCDAVMAQLEEGRDEVTYGTSATSSQASRAELDERFWRLNGR